MRIKLVALFLIISICAAAQSAWITDTYNGWSQRSHINVKPVGDLDDSVYVRINAFFYIKVPKTVFSPPVWDAVTGKPSTFTPSTHSHTISETTGLQAAIDGKEPTITAGTSAQYLKGDKTLGTYQGYTINVQALTSSPADATTVYFGTLPKAPTTTANISKIYIRKAGTLKIAEIYCYSGTAGTNESWSVSIRVNNTTDHLIAAVSASTSERVFSKTDLSISLNVGDYIEIKAVNPTWVTNPLTTIFGGYIYIE